MRMLSGLLHICAKTKALAPVLGGRANNGVHESAWLFRALCSLAWVVCSHGGRRESSLLTFAALFVIEKYDKEKVTL